MPRTATQRRCNVQALVAIAPAASLQLDLEDKIEQFFFTSDKSGVFSPHEAKATISELPPAGGGFLSYEFLPVGPLKPLGLLILEK